MKYKHEVSDSKSPSKKATKKRNPPAQTLTGEISQSIKFQVSEGSSVQERHDEVEEGQSSGDELPTQNQDNEVSVVASSQNKSSQEKSASVKSIFSMEDLSPDDEIYTFQCPQNYNKQDLVRKNLDFTTRNPSITNKGEVYPLQLLDSDKKFITLALPKGASDGTIVKLPLKGHIVIQKAVDIYAVEPVVSDNSDKDTVKFPDDIKVRHPLLGIDWKAHLELADTAFGRYSSKKKSKKRKKEKTLGEDNVGTIKLKEESSESEIGSPKKKKKKYGT